MNKLTLQEERVIVHKGTEAPFSGEYYENNRSGKYFCKRCDAELFSTEAQFDSGCGWPSFDDEVAAGAGGEKVKKVRDADGRRTEILCANCDGHLGHIFHGEGMTVKDARYCVNSISLKFVEFKKDAVDEVAYFAGGCFWGVEYFLKNVAGVKKIRSGYMGGDVENPSYEQVCTKKTGHVETVEIVFDGGRVSFEELCKIFFEIHDPTQANGQGNDVGPQYLSVIFAVDEEQKNVARKLIATLEGKGLKVATEVRDAESGTKKFWPAELYHQNYYFHNGKQPYCHKRIKRF